jgi:hypothetical protein
VMKEHNGDGDQEQNHHKEIGNQQERHISLQISWELRLTWIPRSGSVCGRQDRNSGRSCHHLLRRGNRCG